MPGWAGHLPPVTQNTSLLRPEPAKPARSLRSRLAVPDAVHKIKRDKSSS
jgi:hypothetical protein